MFQIAQAQGIDVLEISGGGIDFDFAQIAGNIMAFLGWWIFAISLALVAIGGLMMVLSAGSESIFENGKKLVIGALIGLAVVLGATIIKTAVEELLQLQP